MQRVNLQISGIEMDYRQANAIARSIAGMVDSEPTVVAWHDGPRKLMSPEIAGADINNAGGTMARATAAISPSL